jgi:hypothetical protein
MIPFLHPFRNILKGDVFSLEMNTCGGAMGLDPA